MNADIFVAYVNIEMNATTIYKEKKMDTTLPIIIGLQLGFDICLFLTTKKNNEIITLLANLLLLITDNKMEDILSCKEKED